MCRGANWNMVALKSSNEELEMLTQQVAMAMGRGLINSEASSVAREVLNSPNLWIVFL